LWEFQTGAGMNSPVSVFEHAGKQYVAAYSAGNLFAGSPKGDSVWLFSLDGTLGAAQPASAVMAFPREAEGIADLENGATVYEAACLFCHGEEGIGGHGGGPTLANVPTVGTAILIVNEGRGDMPAFGAALTAEQIRDVSAYVIEQFGGD
jgi:alcohol dehydrogenase (cytochrome c)